jgi:hypothetical protein
MGPVQRLTAIIEREDNVYAALCPEFDIASQGASIEEARRNLRTPDLVPVVSGATWKLN